MLRRSLVLVAALAALALVPVAAADGGGPTPGVVQGDGVTNAAGTLRYVAVAAGTNTVVEAIRTADARVYSWNLLPGQFGIPLVTQLGDLGGLSADGRTLVLGDATFGNPLRKVSHFAVLDPRNLQKPQIFELPGDLTYDALSPQGRILYVIQRLSSQDLTHYAVRAVDLRDEELLPQRIVDRTEPDEAMQGYPVTRATSADGRFVYTLYQRPSGTPFVHALDTVAMSARCIDLPWRAADQSALWNLRLSVRDGGRTLDMRWRSGRPYVAVDTRSYRISHPHGGFPSLLVGGAAVVTVLLAVAGALLVRRRRRSGAEVDDVGSIEALERIPVLSGAYGGLTED